MLYPDVIEYLYNRLPLFQKQGASALKNGLDGIIKICNHLGNPQEKFKTIHIAGTNGKGSTSHMLASILQEAGFRTGLYTSPHLVDFRERIRLNGKLITQKYVIDFVKKNKEFIESNSFSFFEVTVALAFKYFADSQVDVAIIEVGLGGRLDSTNIINPILSLITNISDDHKQILGDTLVQIASEKAGIIKQNVPVVISTTQSEIDLVFKEKAKEMDAEIHFADQNFEVIFNQLSRNYRKIEVLNLDNDQSLLKYKLDLKGKYQLFNVLGVIKAIDLLNKQGFYINEKSISEGLRKVVKNTGLMGRWQKIGVNPLIYCDTGHNKAGIMEVLKNIYHEKYDNLHMVIGFVKDKDVESILKLLPPKANYYFCQANIPRALETDILLEMASNYGFTGTKFNSVSKAFEMARKQAKSNDLIFVGGSTFVVADLLIFLKQK